MPGDRFSTKLEYRVNKEPENNPSISEAKYGLSGVQVFKQTRVPGVDFAAPPNGYMLLNAYVGINIAYRTNSKQVAFAVRKEIKIRLDVNNIFNVKYREYLNRYRYFVDEPGTNIQLRVIVPLDHTPDFNVQTIE